MASRHPERTRRAHERPAKDLTLTQDETLTGGLGLVGREPVRHSIVLEPVAAARDPDPWNALLELALAGLNCQVMPSTSDAAPGLLAYGEPPLGAQHSPDFFPGQHALRQAVSVPVATTQRAAARAAATAAATLQRGQEPRANANDEPATHRRGRPPKGAARLEQAAQAVDAARPAPQRRGGRRAQGTQRLRAIGHASHGVDGERGGRRHGTRMAGDIQAPIDTMRPIAQHAGLSQVCRERSEQAARVVPTMQAPLACVSHDVRRQVSQLAWTQPASSALHAHRIPSCSRDRVASTRTMTAGAPLRERAERLRPPLCEPGGTWGGLRPLEHNQRKAPAVKLAEVFQRSSANVEGRNGSLSLRNQHLRGREHPSKRAGLTAVHHFFLTRADGTTAAERFFGQKPRSMVAAMWQSVELPPAPLSPPRRAVG